MSEQSFALLPFPAANLPWVNLTGTISFQDNLLSLHYLLAGEVEQILLPRVSPNPSRKDGLWKTTCFEFFLALRDQPDYWEFNMSPSGDWNVYYLETYRRIGFQEETTFSEIPFGFQEKASGYVLDVTLDLTPILRSNRELQVAITAVLETRDGDESYWALNHPAAQPDFHLRDGFILRLAAQADPSEQSARGG